MIEPPEDSANPSVSGVSASDASISDESVSEAVDAASSPVGSTSTSDDSVSDYSASEEAPSGQTSERRLAAILFADVAGYTALSSHDEDLALALIKSFQRVSRKIVAEKGGRVVKFLGDGMLAEFSSLDAAVNAAHSLQNSFPFLKEVKESRVSLRVGVHLGDIVFGDDGDVYGSGVNVASRIEGHAPLSSVVISDPAYQQLATESTISFRRSARRTSRACRIPWSCTSCSWPDRNFRLPPFACLSRPRHRRSQPNGLPGNAWWRWVSSRRLPASCSAWTSAEFKSARIKCFET